MLQASDPAGSPGMKSKKMARQGHFQADPSSLMDARERRKELSSVARFASKMHACM
jgi:hypothetical protein